MVELNSAIGTKDVSVNFTTSNGAANVWRPFDQRSISQAPAIAASSEPMAIKPESTMERSAMAPAKTEPAKIAGQIR